jgi:cobyrinic acid a,c-diamide synthase
MIDRTFCIENHGEELERNASMISSIREFAERDGLIYAECGGLMYLAQRLHTASPRHSYTMAGVLPFDVSMSPRMLMGYCTATPSPSLSSLLRLPPSSSFRCHQYHFSEITIDNQPAEVLDERGACTQIRNIQQNCFSALRG